MLKIIGLINNKKYMRKYIIMSEENISQEFRLNRQMNKEIIFLQK